MRPWWLLVFLVGCNSTGGAQSIQDAGEGGTTRQVSANSDASPPPISYDASIAVDCSSRDLETCLDSPLCTAQCPAGTSDQAGCVPECALKSCTEIPLELCPEGACRITESCDGPTCVSVLNEPNLECGPHGYYSGRVECCEGLVLRCGTLLTNDTCDDTGGFPICLDCGNGQCDALESECNCPEDCL